MSPQRIITYQERINDRLRKKLNYSSPNGYLESLFLPQFVAFYT